MGKVTVVCLSRADFNRVMTESHKRIMKILCVNLGYSAFYVLPEELVKRFRKDTSITISNKCANEMQQYYAKQARNLK